MSTFMQFLGTYIVGLLVALVVVTIFLTLILLLFGLYLSIEWLYKRIKYGVINKNNNR